LLAITDHRWYLLNSRYLNFNEQKPEKKLLGLIISQQNLWLHGSGGALSLPEFRVPGGAVAQQVVVVAGQLLTLTHLNKQQDDQVGKSIWKTTFKHLVRTLQT
jgi:hypothetical protein